MSYVNSIDLTSTSDVGNASLYSGTNESISITFSDTPSQSSPLSTSFKTSILPPGTTVPDHDVGGSTSEELDKIIQEMQRTQQKPSGVSSQEEGEDKNAANLKMLVITAVGFPAMVGAGVGFYYLNEGLRRRHEARLRGSG